MSNHIIILVIFTCILFSSLHINSAKVKPIVQRNDLVVGTLKTGSYQLYQKTVNVTGVTGRILSQDIVYQGLKNITRVRALDQNMSGTGGYASILVGGVGKKNVTLRLQSSHPGRGYSFNIDVFGK